MIAESSTSSGGRKDRGVWKGNGYEGHISDINENNGRK